MSVHVRPTISGSFVIMHALFPSISFLQDRLHSTHLNGLIAPIVQGFHEADHPVEEWYFRGRESKVTKDFSLDKFVLVFSRWMQNVVINTEKHNMRPMQYQADAKYTNPNCGKIRTPQYLIHSRAVNLFHYIGTNVPMQPLLI